MSKQLSIKQFCLAYKNSSISSNSVRISTQFKYQNSSISCNSGLDKYAV